MSILLGAAFFALVVVCIFVGTILGSGMSFRSFGSSGTAILGSGGSFAACITVAVVASGGPLTWVFGGLAALIFGVIMRGAGK